MYLEKDLIKIFKNETIDYYKLSDNYDDKDRTILLDIGLEGMVKFIKKKNINEIFYKYSYVDKESLMITEDYMEKSMDKTNTSYNEITDSIEDKIEEYNAKVERLDDSRPYSLFVFCIYHGKQIGMIENDLWFFNRNTMLPQYELKSIVEENEDLINIYRDKKEKESAKIKEEFHQYLLNDEKFHECINEKLRKNYIKELWDDENHKNFRNAFVQGEHYERYSDYCDFVEMVWREYKKILKEKVLN